MKRLIFIALALTLALGMVWASSVAADGPYPITIIKTIPAGGPEETFTFHAWRDLNNNGIVDCIDPFCDVYLGYVEITGAGTGVILSPSLGACIVREELGAGSAYAPQPDQIAQPGCVPVEFNNEVQVQQVGQIVILKKDPDGNLITVPGATFEISPNPKTCEPLSTLTVVDEGTNDEAPGQIGVLQVTECQVCCACTVTETVAPPGYELDPTPQPAHVTTAGETVELTFVNETCELTIYKVDGSGDPLAGACFTITPDPTTGAGSLELCDNVAPDECPADGVLCLSGLICGLECTVEETVVPPGGYQGADPQTVIIGETLELTFENTREETCGTVCAAQTAPGEFLFSTAQENWFTWIYYNIGWGSEGDPYEYPIYTGIDTLCGTLYVYDNGTRIFVNYELTDIDGGCTLAGLSEYHLQVDESLSDLKKHVMNKKNPVPGKCEYKGYFDPAVPASGWIEADNKSDDISGWTTAYIFAHGIGCYYCP